MHVVFHAVVALIPLTAVVVMFVYRSWKGMFFMENGEFYIYSVVFFAMGLYATTGLGLKKDDWGILLVVLTCTCIGAALVLYGCVVYGKLVSTGKPPDEHLLAITSWVLLGVSLFIFYIAAYWEAYREHVAASKSDDREGVEDLKRRLP